MSRKLADMKSVPTLTTYYLCRNACSNSVDPVLCSFSKLACADIETILQTKGEHLLDCQQWNERSFTISDWFLSSLC